MHSRRLGEPDSRVKALYVGGHGDDDKRLVSVDRAHYRGSERAPLARVEVVAEGIAHRTESR